jgi:hypothetical protein
LKPHTVETAAEKAWSRLKNIKLMDAAEGDGYDLLLTCDKGFRHEQNLKRWKLKVVFLNRGNWPDIRLSIPKIVEAINLAEPGVLTIVDCSEVRR